MKTPDTGPVSCNIREARRMLGVYMIRQADLQSERTKPDSIGMGSYNSDSHTSSASQCRMAPYRTKATYRCRCSPTRFLIEPSHRAFPRSRTC